MLWRRAQEFRVARPIPLRWFKVTILRDGKKDLAYDIRALQADEAKEEAWRRYELAHPQVSRYDNGVEAQIEEIISSASN